MPYWLYSSFKFPFDTLILIFSIVLVTCSFSKGSFPFIHLLAVSVGSLVSGTLWKFWLCAYFQRKLLLCKSKGNWIWGTRDRFCVWLYCGFMAFMSIGIILMLFFLCGVSPTLGKCWFRPHAHKWLQVWSAGALLLTPSRVAGLCTTFLGPNSPSSLLLYIETRLTNSKLYLQYI